MRVSSDDTRTADTNTLVSVIIDNYNYARYLPQAIDSALAQSYPNIEVIVVDDGSTDSSREIIAGYGDRIIPVLKPNGGQASAFNAGFARSRGDVVIFLDSDDVLLPEAIERILPCFGKHQVAKVHWPLWIIDANGHRTGEMRPPSLPTDQDYGSIVRQRGPSNCPSPPTSGNAFARWLLEKILPVPEDVYRICADDYLYTCAPVFGEILSILEPQGLYRIHGTNAYSAKSFDERIGIETESYERQCEVLGALLNRNGFCVDSESWKRHSWFHRLARGVEAIRNHVPKEEQFILIDGGTWDATPAFSATTHPFLEREGIDWGNPKNDDQAVEQLHTWRESNVKYLVIAWPCFWWIDTYPKLFQELQSEALVLLASEEVMIYRVTLNDQIILAS